MPGKYRKRGSYKKLNKRIRKIERNLDGESMVHDTNPLSSTTIASDSPAIRNLAAGMSRVLDAESEIKSRFTGQSIKVKSLLIRGILKFNTSSPNAVVRMGIVRKNTNTDDQLTVMSTPTEDTDLLDYTATAAEKPLMPICWQNKETYKVLWDELIVGNPDAVDNLVFKRYFKLNHKMDFDATPDATKGSLIFYAISDTPNAQNPPTITAYTRIKYADN